MERIVLSGSGWKCKDYLAEDWVWRNGEKRNTRDVRRWRDAVVPGSPLADLYRLGEIPDPYYEKNSLMAEWVSQRTWIFRKEFVVDRDLEGKQVYLHFEGVDYDAFFYLNDVLLGEHHSMFTPVEFEVTELIRRGEKNLLAVVLLKAPEEQPQVSKTRYVKTHKCRMTYWWDFCPRLVHTGIWDDVWLDITAGAKIGTPDLETQLCADFTHAKVSLAIPVRSGEQAGVKAELSDDSGIIAVSEAPVQDGIAHIVLEVENPKLWWPNGYGKQPLYRVELTAMGEDGQAMDIRTLRFGIREVKFVRNAAADPTAHPYTACVNGKKIYMKGYNWVPLDVMYGVRRDERLRRLIQLARNANVNIFRIWGGGLIEKESFYELCDENGIMLWQEFIQSSSGIENKPSEEPAFLKLMEEEAADIIPRKKHHPSLVIWGGGNELSGPEDSMIDEKEPVIAVLKGQVQKKDPSRYFLESSPTGRVFNNTLENIRKDPSGLHDAHGPWEHQGLKKQYELYNAGTSLLLSEFGVEGMTNQDALFANMDPAHLWPPDRDNEYYFHRGLWWNNYALLQECFENRIAGIGQAVRASQFMQYEGLKYAVEANRRRFPVCSGTFPWQFNEPYPNNFCTCSVDYYAAPKPAYYGVKKAYGETVVNAVFAGQSLAGEAALEADVFWQSDFGQSPAAVTARVVTQKGSVTAQSSFTQWPGLQDMQAVKAGRIACPVEKIDTEIFYLLLEARDQHGVKIADNRYLFTKSTLAPLLDLEQTQLCVTAVPGETAGDGIWLRIKNTGGSVAAGVWLEDTEAVREEGYVYFSDNYLYLMPDEEVCIRVEKTADKRIKLRVSSFNTVCAVLSAEDFSFICSQ